MPNGAMGSQVICRSRVVSMPVWLATAHGLPTLLMPARGTIMRMHASTCVGWLWLPHIQSAAPGEACTQPKQVTQRRSHTQQNHHHCLLWKLRSLLTSAMPVGPLQALRNQDRVLPQILQVLCTLWSARSTLNSRSVQPAAACSFKAQFCAPCAEEVVVTDA